MEEHGFVLFEIPESTRADLYELQQQDGDYMKFTHLTDPNLLKFLQNPTNTKISEDLWLHL